MPPSALGPFIRMFDDKFTMDDVRSAVVELEIVGTDNYRLEGRSHDGPRSAAIRWNWWGRPSANTSIPTALCCSWAPCSPPPRTATSGPGFTHKEGDVVRISTPKLGVLENRVTTSKAAPPWTFGISDLMKNLVRRGLLNA